MPLQAETRFLGISRKHNESKLPNGLNFIDQNGRLPSRNSWEPRPGLIRGEFEDAAFTPAGFPIFGIFPFLNTLGEQMLLERVGDEIILIDQAFNALEWAEIPTVPEFITPVIELQVAPRAARTVFPGAELTTVLVIKKNDVKVGDIERPDTGAVLTEEVAITDGMLGYSSAGGLIVPDGVVGNYTPIMGCGSGMRWADVAFVAFPVATNPVVNMPFGSLNPAKRVFRVFANNYYAVGGKNASSESRANFTTDGGINWAETASSMDGFADFQFIGQDVVAHNSKIYWVKRTVGPDNVEVFRNDTLPPALTDTAVFDEITHFGSAIGTLAVAFIRTNTGRLVLLWADVFGASTFRTVFSDDNGATWTTGTWSSTGSIDAGVTTYVAADNTIYLAGGTGGGLVKSTDNGATFVDVSGSIPAVSRLAYAKGNNTDMVIVDTSGDLQHRASEAASFSVVRTGSFIGGQVVLKIGSDIFIGDQGTAVYKSSDDGATWSTALSTALTVISALVDMRA